MQQSPLSPEHDQQPQAPAFNLGALSIGQIQYLNQILWPPYEAAIRAPDYDPLGTPLQEEVLEMFEAAVKASFLDDPERGGELLSTLVASENPHDREMTADCLPEYADHNLTLACDLVLQLKGDDEPAVMDAAGQSLLKIQERLPREQAAELERRREQRRDER